MNLAALSQAERDLIEADKAACLIRYQCRALKGKERQVMARKLLDKVANVDLVKAALEARADASRKQKAA